MGFLIVMLWMIIFLFLAAHFCALLECLFVNSRYQRYEKFKKMKFYKKIVYCPIVHPLPGLLFYIVFCYFIYKVFIFSMLF